VTRLNWQACTCVWPKHDSEVDGKSRSDGNHWKKGEIVSLRVRDSNSTRR